MMVLILGLCGNESQQFSKGVSIRVQCYLNWNNDTCAVACAAESPCESLITQLTVIATLSIITNHMHGQLIF